MTYIYVSMLHINSFFYLGTKAQCIQNQEELWLWNWWIRKKIIQYQQNYHCLYLDMLHTVVTQVTENV